MLAADRRGIRLGHGIVQILPQVNHPAHVAERIATLDIVSNGRVEFGTGEGTGAVEPGAFLVDYETKHEQWEEALDVITRMFVEQPFGGYQGRFFEMPVRNVVPKPVQKPHPPLWVACPRPETIETAATKGLGALCFSMFIEPEEAREWVDGYYSLLCCPRCMPAGFSVNAEVAVVQALMCHDDEATAVDAGSTAATSWGTRSSTTTATGPRTTTGTRGCGTTSSTIATPRASIASWMSPHGTARGRPRDGERKSMRGGIGTPKQLREYFRRYEQSGVDQLLLYSQVGRNDHEHICESLELFAREVMPEFVERDKRLPRGEGEATGAVHRAGAGTQARAVRARVGGCRPGRSGERRLTGEDEQ